MGSATVTFSSGFSVGGTNASDFSIASTTCGSSVASGSNCYLYVKFTPSIVGQEYATIQIASDASGSPQTVYLSGIGQAQTQTIDFEPSTLIFASQTVGTTSGEKYIYLYNEGTAPVSFTSVQLTGGNSGDFAIAQNECPSGSSTLAAGSDCYVYLTFTPSAAGTRSTTLQFTDSATGSPQNIPITGSASVPVLYTSATELNFGTQNIGVTSSNRGTNIYNEGTGTLTISNISVTGANAADFGITLNNCGSSLTAGAGCTIDAGFTPSVVGPETAAIQITDSASGSPHTITLNGIGQAVTNNTLTLSDTQLTFQLQNVGTTSAGVQELVIYNYGTGPVSLSGISLTGANAGDFGIVVNNCGSSIAAGSDCVVELKFTPTAAGPRSASLQIASSAIGSPQSVSVFGTGEPVTEDFVLSDNTLTFATTNVGSTSSIQELVLYNYGTGPVTFASQNPFTITGANAGDFAFTLNNCGSTIAAGSDCVIEIAMRPSAIGTRTAALQISDDATGSPQTVALIGNGQDVTSTLTLSDTTLSFGLVITGVTSPAQEEVLYNHGTSVLNFAASNAFTISGPNASDFAISFNNCGTSVASGSDCVVRVVFTPSTGSDETATLSIADSAPDTPQIITLVGTGAPSTQSLVLQYNELTFGPQNIGTTSSQTAVSMWNYGNTQLTFSGFSIAGANAGDFAISQNNCSSTLAPNAGCTVWVTFAPTAVDARMASLQIADSATGSPQSVSLFGTGQTPVQAITLEYSNLNFGTQTVGTTSSAQYVYLYNTGNAAVTLNSFNITGANSTEFAISQNQCGSSLAAGASCYVYMTFTPAAAGQRSATLQIGDSAPGSPQAVSLFGLGQ